MYGYNGYLLQHGTVLTILFLTKSAATYEENIVSFLDLFLDESSGERSEDFV